VNGKLYLLIDCLLIQERLALKHMMPSSNNETAQEQESRQVPRVSVIETQNNRDSSSNQEDTPCASELETREPALRSTNQAPNLEPKGQTIQGELGDQTRAEKIAHPRAQEYIEGEHAVGESSAVEAQRGRTRSRTARSPAEESPVKCSICLELFTSPALLLPCGHAFDLTCVLPWLRELFSNQGRATCPLCRSDVILIQHNRQDDGNYDTLVVEEHFRYFRRDQSWGTAGSDSTDIFASQLGTPGLPTSINGNARSNSRARPVLMQTFGNGLDDSDWDRLVAADEQGLLEPGVGMFDTLSVMNSLSLLRRYAHAFADLGEDAPTDLDHTGIRGRPENRGTRHDRAGITPRGGRSHGGTRRSRNDTPDPREPPDHEGEFSPWWPHYR
jgi:hypothetical protein